MTKEKSLFLSIGVFLGICIGVFVGITECPVPHRDELAWYEYKLVIDLEDQTELPYKVYDRDGIYLGKVNALDLDSIIH